MWSVRARGRTLPCRVWPGRARHKVHSHVPKVLIEG